MSTTIRRVLALAVVLAMASAGVWLYRSSPLPAASTASQRDTSASAAVATNEGRPPAQPASVASAESPQTADIDPAPTSSTVLARPSVVLPPEDLPLAQVRGDLESRARAGDAAAALRLYTELERCTPRARRSEDAQARALACLQRTHCGDVVTERRWDWLVQAALAGDPQAQALAVQGSWVQRGAVAHRAAASRLYRAHALQWAMALARRGHAPTLTLLAAAHASPDAIIESPLAMLVQQDRVQAAAYERLAQLVRGDAPQDTAAFFQSAGWGTPGPAEVRAVHAWVERWQAQHPPDRSVEALVTAFRPWTLDDVRRLAPQCLQAGYP